MLVCFSVQRLGLVRFFFKPSQIIWVGQQLGILAAGILGNNAIFNGLGGGFLLVAKQV